MPAVQLDPTLEMYYEDHCFADPWHQPETVLMVHGVAESSRSWYAWVPHLARHYRVLRVDQRGFGRSTVPPPGYPWSPASFAADLDRFLETMKIDRVHLLAAKFGGTIALQFAADYPKRVRTLSVVSSPGRPRYLGTDQVPPLSALIRDEGVRAWAARTMRARLGSDAPPEQVAWWTDFMGAASRQVCFEVTMITVRVDLMDVVPRIQAPTLVFTTEGSALASLETTRSWQERIPNSRLLVLPGDSYHVAATHPDLCARHVLAFLQEHASTIPSDNPHHEGTRDTKGHREGAI